MVKGKPRNFSRSSKVREKASFLWLISTYVIIHIKFTGVIIFVLISFLSRLRHKIQIVIGTPGRINDVIDNHEGALQLHHIKMVVLDEVDVMLQMGFQNQVTNLS